MGIANKPDRQFLIERYQQLWDGTIDLVRQGEIKLDPLLASRVPDQRHCLTVLIRPSTEIQQSVVRFLNELRRVDPGQYYYQPAELHVTVLSLFTATMEYEKHLIHYDRYLEAVNAALASAPSFSIDFTGITLTRDAIMVQGYFDDTILNDTRETLRKELKSRELTEGLDGRYVLQTAHMTVVRFRQPLQNSQPYTEMLERYRNHSFGQTHVQELNLVRNDWYMSTQSVEILKRYQLSSNSTPHVSPPF